MLLDGLSEFCVEIIFSAAKQVVEIVCGTNELLGRFALCGLYLGSNDCLRGTNLSVRALPFEDGDKV